MALYSLVYEVASGALIEVGPAGTDWGSGVHAPPAGAKRIDPKPLRPEVIAARAKCKVADGTALDLPTFAALRMLSRGQGGDGLTKTSSDFALQSLPQPDPTARIAALALIAAAKQVEP